MAAHNINNINAQNGRNHLIHNRGERFIRPAGVPFRPTTTPQSVSQELAAKCQNFLDTLVRLADNKGQNVGIKVRELVSQLINEELQPEDFGALISSTVIGSRPQPGLVPFLQRSLPCLRRMRAIGNQPRVNGPPTLIDTSRTSQNILPSGYSGRLPGDGVRLNAPPSSSQSLSNIHSTSNAVSINTNRPLSSRQSNHPTQLISSNSVPLQPRANMPQEMTLGHTYFRQPGSQGTSPAVLVPAQITSGGGDNNLRLKAVPPKFYQIARTSSPQLNSNNVPIVRDDEPALEDINDVTSQTGVNINEEASYLTEDTLGPVQQLPKAPQRQPHIITSNSLLSSKISSIAAKHQLEEHVPSDVVSLVSQACQMYLKNLIEKFGVAAQHRSELLCHETRYEKESEIKSQLKFFQQIEIAENQRRKEIEREMLVKTAKSRSKNEDPDEQQRAKKKVKELEMAQTERMATSQTNAAAIHALDDALGPPRKRMLRDLTDGGSGPFGNDNGGSPFSSTLPLTNGSGPSWLNPTVSGDGSRRPGASNWVPRKVVTLRDAVLVLEQEKTLKMSEEQGLPKIPNLKAAELKFRIQQNPSEYAHLKEELLAIIQQDAMTPFYKELCKDLNYVVDESLVSSLESENKTKLEELDKKISDAEANFGESDIRDANLAKAEYLCRIGDKEACLALFRKIQETSLALGQKLDIVFYCIRIGLFYMDTDLIERNIEKAKSLVEQGGDWDRRNRLKVYEGVYHMYNRDFKAAVKLFLDAVSTFTSTELMSYDEFVRYTVYMAIVTLPRVDIKAKVIDNDEIQQRLNCSLPEVKQYLMSLYESDYATFFVSLIDVEGFLKVDRYLYKHYRYYIKEIRIIGYSQILHSYRSVTLQYIADAFNVSVAFIDKELARFIAANRLPCKINKVRGIVETTRPDSKNYQYQQLIKQGDHLLNRVQKLSRVINL